MNIIIYKLIVDKIKTRYYNIQNQYFPHWLCSICMMKHIPNKLSTNKYNRVHELI